MAKSRLASPLAAVLLLAAVLGGCGKSTPAALPIGAPPSERLPPGTHLVEHVTAAHFGPQDRSEASRRLTTDDFETTLDAWTSTGGMGGTLAPGGGRAGSTALALGPDARSTTPYRTRQLEVKAHQRCTVSVWVRTDGLVGRGPQAGARMEVLELARSKKKKKKADGSMQLVSREAYRHLPHLAGTTPWTLQSIQIDVARKTRALEVRLTSGHDGRSHIGGRALGGTKGEVAGTAYFDDLRVECAAPGFPDGPGTAVAGAQDAERTRRVAIDDDNRPAVLVDGTVAWSVEVDRSKPMVLSTAVGLLDGTHKKAHLCFALRVDGELRSRRCRKGTREDERMWMPMELELPARPGESSRIAFETRLRSDPTATPTLAAWADPILRPTEVPAERPPDVLVILVDTLRADAVHAASGRRPGATPHMDALAARGTLYEQARSPTSWTLPSSATLLTGQHPFRHGAGWRLRRGGRTNRPTTDVERRLHYSGVVDGTPFLAGLMREQGYLTRGWYSNHYLDPRFGLATGFSRWVSFKSSDIPGAARAVAHLERALEARPLGGPQPQLLFVHVIDPHLPYLARLPLAEGFSLSDELKLEEQTQDGRSAMVLQTTNTQTQAHVEAVREIYDTDVHYLDEMVGELVSLVDDDTLVIVTSDHGEAFVEHGEYQHGSTLYEEVLRIPLLVRWPGGEQAGTRVDHPVALADVTATVLETAGVDLPEGFDGQPLPRPGATPSPRPMVFSHVYNGPDRVGVLDWPYKRLVRLPDMGIDPLVRRKSFDSDLYDLSVDPTEQDDLSAREPQLLARMDALVAAQIDTSIPGTHLRCATPHPPLSLRSDQAFVRGLPLSAGEVTVSDDRKQLTVTAAPTGSTRLVVEAQGAADVQVTPAEACELWRVAVPDMEVTLDQDQVEHLRAIGYME